jgi:hypothetical protein
MASVEEGDVLSAQMRAEANLSDEELQRLRHFIPG